MKRILFSIFLVIPFLWGNIPSLETIQEKVIHQFSRIDDYQVDIKIAAKMTGFRMPKKNIRMYYKKPDKMKIKSTGFAILPKMGTGGNPMEFFSMLTDVTEIKKTSLDGIPFYKITGFINRDSLKISVVLDENDTLNVIMKVYINAENWTMTQVDVFLDSEHIFIFETKYMNVKGFWVPERSEFKLGIKGVNNWSIRNPFGGPAEDQTDFKDIVKGMNLEEGIAGSVIMKFSNYKINQGLDDVLFNE